MKWGGVRLLLRAAPNTRESPSLLARKTHHLDARQTACFSSFRPPNEEPNCGSIYDSVGESVGAVFCRPQLGI